MASIKCQVCIDAPYDKIWSEAWRAISQPMQFIGVTAKILQRQDNMIVRQMEFEGDVSKQRVVRDSDKGTLHFTALQGSTVQGSITHTLEKRDGKNYYIYESNFKKNGQLFPTEEVFKMVSQKLKEVIESKK